MKSVHLSAIALLLAGCAAQDIKALRAEGVTTVIASPLPLQDTYRLLNTQMRQCWATAGIGAAVQADSQIYADNAEITLYYPRGPFTGETGPLVRAHVRTSGAGTSVELLTKRGKFGRQAPERVRAWLEGSTECR